MVLRGSRPTRGILNFELPKASLHADFIKVEFCLFDRSIAENKTKGARNQEF